mgnify:CR=1 FL=1
MSGLHRHSLKALTLAVCLSLAGCGTGTVPATAYGEAGLADTPEQRLSVLSTMDARVNAVGYRLAVANTQLCPDTGPVTGLLLHAETQYSDYLRQAARERWGLDGDLPGLAAVAPDSPAARAGLRVGDLLISVNGVPFAKGEPGAPAAFEGLAANIDRLDKALPAGDVRLVVRRAGLERTVTLTPVEACAYVFQVDPSTEMNARADGHRVYIASAMVAFLEADDDLAVILGHEMAHNVLEHREFFDERGFARSILGNYGNAPWELVAAEREADRVGLYLMARAGYDPSRAPLLWTALVERTPGFRYAQWAPPSARSRARAQQATVDDIREQQSSGNIPAPF